jgi:hypothetical protein
MRSTTTIRQRESGVALLSAILVLALMSALLVGFVAVVNGDQMSSGVGRDQTQAYAAAHAGLEKLTADLGQVFAANYAPTGATVNGLELAPPTVPGVTFVAPSGGPGYEISYIDRDNNGMPDVERVEGSDITSGPYAGLKGIITPYMVDVTARTNGGAEVRMRRTMQSVGIPVFQFGIFSETDLSFHSGDDFYFGGRVHSNENVFIASATGATLVLGDRVTAVGEVVRRRFVNGNSSTGYTGTVQMAKTSGCTPTTTGNCRVLAQTEGSVTDGPTSTATSNWVTLSTGLAYYNQWIRNGDTGAKRLDLPLTSDGAEAIDLIRRGRTADSTAVASQRFYGMASLRILLADTEAELTGLPGVEGTPVSLETIALGAPMNKTLAGAGTTANGYRSTAGTPTIGGYILINKLDNAATPEWSDVTEDVLTLGVTGLRLNGGCAVQDVDAVIRLQRLKDSAACAAPTSTDLIPNTLYDAREAVRRNEHSTGTTTVYLGGVMHYVELDVANLKKWFDGTIAGGAGDDSQDTTGYVVYFSDRRTNNDGANSTGEYGWEDIVNTDAAGTPNDTLNPGEDFNGSNSLQLYGRVPQLGLFAPVSPAAGSYDYTSAYRPNTLVSATVAKVNRAVFFRRALKVVNGGRGSLPSNGAQGLTIASENPVYIQGNFNACGSPTAGCATNGFTDGAGTDVHKSAAVIADSVTLLSRNWNDNNSYTNPHNINSRMATETWYRLGIISGKGRTFPHPGNAEFANFGSDGGAHNFLRFLENWSNVQVNYRGSMISLYTSRQGTGTWKCCGGVVYSPPDRESVFETEFLTPSLLPPRTPMFRDINTLTFRQILRPTQQ